ncbi:MAG: hypothetical protein GC185_04600 [Alphaproteobacteria bacterium]|nr:hypothetical protein [Alphaproteobacteria bacterium]
MTQTRLSIRTTLLGIIGLLNILVAFLVGANVHGDWQRLDDVRTLARGSAATNRLYTANKYLSLERANTLSVLYVAPDTASALREEIAEDRAKAEKALSDGLAQVAADAPAALTGALTAVKRDRAALQKLRGVLDADLEKPVGERDDGLSDRFFRAETGLITRIAALVAAYDKPLRAIDATVGQQVLLKRFVWQTTEYAGREYAVIGRLIAQNKPVTPGQQEELRVWSSLTRNGWNTIGYVAGGSGLDRQLSPYLDEAKTHYLMTFGQVKDLFFSPAAVSSNSPYPLSPEMWLVLASQAVDSLSALKDASLQQTQAYVNGVETRAERRIGISALFFAAALGVSLYCLLTIIMRVIRPVNAMVEALYKTAQGEEHAPLPERFRYDEIGKLASVLTTLEDNFKQIRQSNEELERYAYITAHDLRSPLRAIDNLSRWIEEDLEGVMQDETRQHMAAMRQRVARMEKLLSDTLEYSRISRDAKKTSGEIMTAAMLVEDAVAMAAPPPGVTVRIGEELAGIELHRLPVQQVFYNLINNAIKHRDGETGTVAVSAETGPDFYTFTVADDGPGIEKRYHEKIFEMFQTLKPRDEREGSGMGLAIVKKILTTQGGIIKVESEAGKGTRFYFTWPRQEVRKNGISQAGVGNSEEK